MDKVVEYFTRDSLIRANKRALRLKLNRGVEPEWLEQKLFADPQFKYPVSFKMVHEGDKKWNAGIDCMRYVVQLSSVPNDTIQMDVPLKFVNKDVKEVIYREPVVTNSMEHNSFTISVDERDRLAR